MGEPLRSARHVRAVRVERKRRLLVAQDEVAAHAGAEVDYDVHVRGADALDDLAVEGRVARALAGCRVAHVNMDDRGPAPARLDRGVGDVAREHRHELAPVRRRAGPGHGTGDEDVSVHGTLLRV
jgi:hypothetical protein